MTIPKDVQSLLDELGLEVLAVRTKNHIVIRLRNRHGAIASISICKTPSDRRSRLNEMAALRRIDGHRPVRHNA